MSEAPELPFVKLVYLAENPMIHSFDPVKALATAQEDKGSMSDLFWGLGLLIGGSLVAWFIFKGLFLSKSE